METSECSAVSFSLSDIQLPKSPAEPSGDLKSEKIGGKLKKESENRTSNGEAACDSKSSHEGGMSDSETKENYNNKSPEENKENKDSKDSRHSGASSDVESDRNSSPIKKKPTSDVADDSDKDKPRDFKNKCTKSTKDQGSSEESGEDKSSDSDKYNHHHHSVSKHKSHSKRRKRNRRSPSSSSSSSQSSDSSPKRRPSKKSLVVLKDRNLTENDESNKIVDKSLDERLKKTDSALEASVSSVPHKKRLKIKRDNVPVEASSVADESVEKVTSEDKTEKSKDSKDSSHSTSIIVPSQESRETKEIAQKIYTPRKVILSNRKLNRTTSEEAGNAIKSKKSKWDSFAASQKISHTISISTDSLKNWFPDFKLINEASSSMEIDQDESSLPTINEKDRDQTSGDVSVGNEAMARRESTSQNEMDEFESQEPRFEGPVEKGPVSKMIFIQNLVRPFTLNQLKELLKQSGNLVEEYFWIDKIKSKCFVMYETEKEASKARNALHNARWPASNPKILSVEFSNEDELELHKRGNEQPPPPKPPEIQESEPLEDLETRVSHPVEDHKRKERERRKERDRSKGQGYVREWDKDKIIQESPEREHIPKEEKSRSSEKKEKKESKKRPNEDTPAKLLDDLFQKTKSLPCIYWLPLTEEQAKQKEEEKKMRKLERDKRLQQKEQEETDRHSKRDRSGRRSREKENRRSSSRSRSPAPRRR